MGRIWLTLSDDSIDYIDNECARLGLSRSSFIEILLSEHNKTIPITVKYRDIIFLMSQINTTANEILISKSFDASKQLLLESLMKDFQKKVNQLLV